jgi:hypothetical protein
MRWISKGSLWLRLIPLALILALVALLVLRPHGQTHTPGAASSPATTSPTALSSDVGDLALAHSTSPVVLPPLDQQVLILKGRLAQEYAQVQAGQVSPAAFQRDWSAFAGYDAPAFVAIMASYCPPTCLHTANRVPMPQESQINMYYCGPAAVEEVLIALDAKRGPRGEWLTAGPYPAHGQHVLAEIYYLQTDADIGTNWGSGVVPKTLNAWYKHHYYVAINGTNMGGYFSLTTYEHDLILDVDSGHPLIGGLRMDPTPTHPHLIGYPTNQLHYHWIALDGYTNSGADTVYADSVHGDTQFWWWADRVPAFGTVSTKTIMFPLLNTFGYVW